MRLYFCAGSISVQSAPKRRPIPYISPPSTLPDFTMSRSSSSPLSYVTLPDPQAKTPSRQSLPPPSSPPPAASASTSSSQPQSRPVSETKSELQGSERRTFTQTLTAGLAELTDLTLENRSDLEEVKQLVYGRYDKEDECKEKCKAQCAEIRHAVASIAEGFTRRAASADAVRTTAASQGESSRYVTQFYGQDNLSGKSAYNPFKPQMSWLAIGGLRSTRPLTLTSWLSLARPSRVLDIQFARTCARNVSSARERRCLDFKRCINR